jgi:hypothetical protein
LNAYFEKKQVPNTFARPRKEEFLSVLLEYLKLDPAPRSKRIVEKLTADPGILAC